MPVELRPHQAKALEKLANGKILYGGTGSGKTITALAYYMKEERGKDVYVITTARKRDSLDWQEEAAKFGVGSDSGSTLAGVLTVESWNQIDRFVDVEDAFFIFDEQRLVGSGAWVKAFYKIAKANRWIMLSATPGDTWLDFIPVFVANGFYKNKTEFIREHVVYASWSKFPRVERYVNTARLVKHRRNLLVHMPYKSPATRIQKYVNVSHDEALFERVVKDRWHVYENRPLRDKAELFSVMRKVVNSDSTRLQALESLLNKHPRVIVFYNFDYELEILRSLSESRKQLSLSSSETDTAQPHRTNGMGQTQSLVSLDQNAIAEDARLGESMSMEIDPLKGTIWEKGFDEKKALGNPDYSVSNPVDSSRSSEQSSLPSSVSTESFSSSSTQLTPERSGGSKSQNKQRSDTFKLAEWNGHKHEPIPDSPRWVYLVQYQAGAEAWNCTSTDAMCFWSLTYSYKLWHQAHGRIDRLNTPYDVLNYYVLVSKSLIDKLIMASLRAKKSFNEKDVEL